MPDRHLSWIGVNHFSPEEFSSPDMPESGYFIHPLLVVICERVRNEYGAPVKINSGVRSIAHNKSVGGTENSAHLIKDGVGNAIDVSCTNSRLRFIILDTAIRSGIKRIGIGENFIHLDTDNSLDQEVIWHYYK